MRWGTYLYAFGEFSLVSWNSLRNYIECVRFGLLWVLGIPLLINRVGKKSVREKPSLAETKVLTHGDEALRLGLVRNLLHYKDSRHQIAMIS